LQIGRLGIKIEGVERSGFFGIAFAVAVGALPAGVARASNCAATPMAVTPVPQLGANTYLGYAGGLYPGGSNVPPISHHDGGLREIARVQPLDAGGALDCSNGKIAFVSIGMSNTTQEFQIFKRLADADPRKNPRLTIVDGAQGGQDAIRISDPASPFWQVVDQRLAAAGATREQVQAIWLKQAYAGPREPFPADARKLQNALRTIHGILVGRFPNLKLVYLSSRIYAGYATTTLNPEPYAYQTGFAVKWTVQDRIEGRLKGPWVGWGPYLWADGLRARSDGLTWEVGDFAADGTHPSPSGRQKVAERLLRFFTTARTSRGWFVVR
jgi:hypothetical protein